MEQPGGIAQHRYEYPTVTELTPEQQEDNKAALAISGLRASIEAGYLDELRATRIFTHYFPNRDFLTGQVVPQGE